ncbi:MAG: DnaB-like helicase C-terminal domain-containing protein, partial [Bacteroidales bacterium]|nr:DnaB-like helicase C-terminal domain-containing protein [Bacteroidales bacterium]
GGTKKPILSDLRESGAIEQDADMVLFIYRPEYYNIEEYEDGNTTTGIAEINIAKNRNGPLADIRLRFIKNYAKFVDIEPDEYESFDSQNINLNIDNKQTIHTIPSKMNDMEDEETTPF